MSERKSLILVLGCYLIWGLLPIFWKLMADMDPFYVLANRIFWSLLFSVVLVLLGPGFGAVRQVMRDRRELLSLLAASILIAFNWGSYIWSVNNCHMIDASLAYYMSPIFVIVLGAIIYREKLNLLQWISVGLVGIGLIITMIRFGCFPWLAIMMGSIFSIYGAIKKRVKADAVTASFWETLFTTPASLIYIILMEQQGNGAIGLFHGWQWLLLPICGIVTTVPLLLYSKGVKKVSLSLCGILMYINPTMQLLLSVFCYHELFDTTSAILFSFVWAAVFLYLLSFRRNRNQ